MMIRFLHCTIVLTLLEVGGGTSNTIVAFPLPIELFRGMLHSASANGRPEPAEPAYPTFD